MPHALIVEDDPNSLSGLAAILSADGFSVDVATTLAEARAALTRFIPDVVLVDLNLPDGRGLDLLQNLPSQPPDGTVPVIVMTGNATVESAIEGLRHGIWDYLLKPVSIPRLRSLLARIPRPYELTEEVQSLRSALRHLGRFGPMVGRSATAQRIYDAIERVAPTEAAVLVYGEPGSGKETIARALHDTSRRKKGPFVKLDCGGIGDERPFENLMFGQEHSAYPSANTRENGVLELSAGGTLFLDHVTDLSLHNQQTLLRAFEARTFRRIGGATDIATDFRLIAAADVEPQRALAEGALREDLWQRLNVVPLEVPPLRERGQDVELLAQHFVDQLNYETGANKRMSALCIDQLSGYHWPGNIAEMRQRIERAYRASDTVIESIDADEDGAAGGAAMNGSSVQVTVGTPLATVEELLIRATLDAVGGTRHRAASMLGISPKTLYNKLQRMKLE